MLSYETFTERSGEKRMPPYSLASAYAAAARLLSSTFSRGDAHFSFTAFGFDFTLSLLKAITWYLYFTPGLAVVSM